jgi:hypothetical protein
MVRSRNLEAPIVVFFFFQSCVTSLLGAHIFLSTVLICSCYVLALMLETRVSHPRETEGKVAVFCILIIIL